MISRRMCAARSAARRGCAFVFAAAKTLLTAAAIAVAALAALAMAPTHALGAPLNPRASDWDGLSEFVAIASEELGESRVALATKLDFGVLTPNDSLVLVHPQRSLDTEELSVFLHAGGRVLLLDDYGRGDELLGHFGIQRVPLPVRPAAMLQSNPAFAIADAIGTHPAVHDVARVVTDHATGLADTKLAPLLVVRGAPDDVLLAVAGVVGRGRLLAVGDCSVAMNAMLRYPGNRALAYALIRYAAHADSAEADARSGSGKMYVLVNDFANVGRYTDARWRTGTAANARRAAVTALDAVRRGMPPLGAYLVAIAVGVGVVFWTATRAGRMYRPTTPRFVRGTPLEAQGGVAGHVAALRASGAPRGLVLAELGTALQEHLTTRLGLDRGVPPAELVGRVRAAGWLGESALLALAATLARLSTSATAAEGRSGRRRGVGRPATLDRVSELEPVSEAEVLRVAATVRRLVAAVDAARRGDPPRASSLSSRPAPAPRGKVDPST